MAKKPMTKAQIVTHFAEKFELSKRAASAMIDEVGALAVSETKKTGSFNSWSRKAGSGETESPKREKPSDR